MWYVLFQSALAFNLYRSCVLRAGQIGVAPRVLSFYDSGHFSPQPCHKYSFLRDHVSAPVTQAYGPTLTQAAPVGHRVLRGFRGRRLVPFDRSVNMAN